MLKRTIAAALAVPALALCAPLPPAQADVPVGCEDLFWWQLGATRRLICDGPRAADGSWQRFREFYTPAHNVPLTTYCSGGRYYSSCSTSGGYWQPRTSMGVEQFTVFDYNVVAGEPGWLPPNQVVKS